MSPPLIGKTRRLLWILVPTPSGNLANNMVILNNGSLSLAFTQCFQMGRKLGNSVTFTESRRGYSGLLTSHWDCGVYVVA